MEIQHQAGAVAVDRGDVCSVSEPPVENGVQRLGHGNEGVLVEQGARTPEIAVAKCEELLQAARGKYLQSRVESHATSDVGVVPQQNRGSSPICKHLLGRMAAELVRNRGQHARSCNLVERGGRCQNYDENTRNCRDDRAGYNASPKL